jgi:hypothetical protein
VDLDLRHFTHPDDRVVVEIHRLDPAVSKLHFFFEGRAQGIVKNRKIARPLFLIPHSPLRKGLGIL